MSEQPKGPQPGETASLKAEKRQQAGQDILVARCPRCGATVALSGPGKYLCPCGVTLDLQA